MFYSHDRTQLRNTYFSVWDKMQCQHPLSTLEADIANVIDGHTEYHYIFANKEHYLDAEYTPQQGTPNPFLHMSLHLALREQLSTNRPKGITSLYRKALQKLGTEHATEHLMMEALSESLWIMQDQQQPISDNAYLKVIKKHLRKASI